MERRRGKASDHRNSGRKVNMLIRVVLLATRNVLLMVAALVLLCSAVIAQQGRGVPAGYSTATAQGVADIMAYYGRVGHWGGNPSYEGCGMAQTKEGAYAICCYANSGMRTVDVGYAQGKSGYWFCCRRYVR